MNQWWTHNRLLIKKILQYPLQFQPYVSYPFPTLEQSTPRLNRGSIPFLLESSNKVHLLFDTSVIFYNAFVRHLRILLT